MNSKPVECLLCGFAVLKGSGRIAGKSWVHSDLDECKRLTKEHQEQTEKAFKRKILRDRLVARITGQRSANAGG